MKKSLLILLVISCTMVYSYAQLPTGVNFNSMVSGGIQYTIKSGTSISGPATFTGQNLKSKSTNPTDWFWQNPLLDGKDLISVRSLGPVVYSVGSYGKIMYSPNDGTNWFLESSGTYNYLMSAFFINANKGFAVGTSGTILKTLNGGINWNIAVTGYTNTFRTVYFTDALNGYIAGSGGLILKTKDGGDNWFSVTSNTINEICSICFTDIKTGYAAGYNGTILQTTDTGNNWIAKVSNTSNNLLSVYFYNASTGYAVGNSGTISKTIDAGQTWNIVPTGMTSTISSIYFSDANHGYILYGGLFMVTSNGGSNWNILNIFNSTYLSSFYFTDPNNFYVVGGSGMICHVNISGPNYNNFYITYQYPWNVFGSLNFVPIWSVQFPTTNIGYAACDKGDILKTIDGGNTWSVKHYVPNTLITTRNYYSVCFTDINTGYIAGSQGTIIKTNDAGANWSYRITNQTSGTIGAFHSIFFSDDTTGYAVGDYGRIVSTSDSGANWTNQNSGINSNLLSVYFTDKNTGYAVGDSGKILKTIDTGNNWVPLNSGTLNTLNSVFFTNDSTGFAAGDHGTIIKTFDRGNNWTPLPSGTTNNLSCLYFIDNDIGYASGNNGTILRTINGGNTWTMLDLQVNGKPLNSIYFTNVDTGYVVGSYSAILKTIDGGCTKPAVTAQPVNASVCLHDSIFFEVTDNGTALSFQWQVDSGSGFVDLSNNAMYSNVDSSKLIISGVIQSMNNYHYHCILTNSCGNTLCNDVLLTVNNLPSPSITGALSYCDGDSTQLSVVYYNHYAWSTGDTTQSIYATVVDNPVTITVTDFNGCSNTVSATVTQNPIPPTPVVTLNGSVLTSSSTGGNQWYNQNGLINGASSQNYNLLANGIYYVIVTINGCPSDTSNIISVTTSIQENIDHKDIIIYPNPSSGNVTIIAGADVIYQEYLLEINDILGNLVLQKQIVKPYTQIDISHLAEGSYYLKFTGYNQTETLMIIKE